MCVSECVWYELEYEGRKQVGKKLIYIYMTSSHLVIAYV